MIVAILLVRLFHVDKNKSDRIFAWISTILEARHSAMFQQSFFFIRQRKTGFINFQFVHSTWPNVSFIENIYGARAYSMNLHFSVHTSLIAHGIRSNWALFSSQRNVLVCIFSSVFIFWIDSSVYWWVRSYAMRTHSFFCARSFHHFWWLQRNEKHIDITAFCYKLEGAYIRNSNKKRTYRERSSDKRVELHLYCGPHDDKNLFVETFEFGLHEIHSINFEARTFLAHFQMCKMATHTIAHTHQSNTRCFCALRSFLGKEKGHNNSPLDLNWIIYFWKQIFMHAYEVNECCSKMTKSIFECFE